MSWILGISGVLCFIYFAAILIFSGPGTSFAFIWLAMALVLIGSLARPAAAAESDWLLSPTREAPAFTDTSENCGA